MTFVQVTSGDMPFENFAGVKLAVEASGTVENMVILEEMDMNKAAEQAAKSMAGYKPAWISICINFQLRKAGS
jgi:uncharacterized protein with GYD domain